MEHVLVLLPVFFALRIGIADLATRKTAHHFVFHLFRELVK